MKADLSGQIHELMERGLRPVTMTDIKSTAPVRITVLRRAMARSRLACSSFSQAPGRLSAPVGKVAGIAAGSTGPRRAIAAAVAGIGSLGVIAGVIGIAISGRPLQPTAADKGAVDLLAKLAAAAAHQPALDVWNSQYMYVETRAAVPSLAPAHWTGKTPPFPRHVHLKMITSQVWVPVDNLCRSSAFSAQEPGVKCPNIGWLNDPTYRLLQTLPTSPHALLAMIYRTERGHGPNSEQEAFVTVGDLLRNTIAPPKVAAALYRVAALIPGVTLVHDATDAIGRHGVAIARMGPGIDGGVREELIFSSATSQLIGERTVIARTGVTTSATAIIDRAFVDHRGQVPSAGKRTMS